MSEGKKTGTFCFLGDRKGVGPSVKTAGEAQAMEGNCTRWMHTL